MCLIISSIILSILYFILVSIFIIGWKKNPIFVNRETDLVFPTVSIVIACKNEEKNIPKLVSALENLSYKNFELIFINDHSKDKSREQLLEISTLFKNIQIIDAIGFGKKNAIKEGIHKATGDLIVTTDADCIPNAKWIETILQFQIRNPSDLIICPVKFSGNTTFFSKLQEIEFVSLIASGAGAAGVSMPILCNGANMAFTRNIWLKSQSDLHEEEQSGDDIFLLQSVKKRGGIIRFLKSQTAFVTTQPSQSFMDFFKQRRRWASKAPKYTDWHIILTAFIVLLINLLLLILLIFSFLNVLYLISLIAVFSFKYLLDSLFIRTNKHFFKLKNVWFYSFFLSVIYPFYIFAVGFSGLLVKPNKWK